MLTNIWKTEIRRRPQRLSTLKPKIMINDRENNSCLVINEVDHFRIVEKHMFLGFIINNRRLIKTRLLLNSDTV